MKKLVLSLGIMALGFMAIANPPKKTFVPRFNTYLANQSLVSMYGKVDQLEWKLCANDLLRANYVIDGEKFSSFFDQEGNFLATTTFVMLEDMPTNIRKKVKEKFEGHEIKSIVHRSTESEISYFVEVMEQGKTRVYQVKTSGVISRFQ